MADLASRIFQRGRGAIAEGTRPRGASGVEEGVVNCGRQGRKLDPKSGSPIPSLPPLLSFFLPSPFHPLPLHCCPQLGLDERDFGKRLHDKNTHIVPVA